ncbi:MAG TPA: type II toxin-antitoxin system prevent-host-death family antitoxin [Salinarimonas sp.]|jgi:prevent-host-death family protein|nr:type II toxin-antitoxin system prevent-host-death family antitoxin [Salinarimonas sp.]
MTIVIKVDDMDQQLAELVRRVEAGEVVVIERDDRPIARVVPADGRGDVKAAIEQIRAARATRKPVTLEEIIAWKNEGRA